MDYEKDITIDENALDIEWLDQASLALKYAKHLTQLKARVARLEEKKKTKRSELILEVNENPIELMNKKTPNAADIEAYYRTDEEYKEIVKELLLVQEEAEFAELAFQEIAWTRKKSLEYLVILHGQQYFAGPKIPRDLSKEWEQREQQKRSDEGVGKKMKRRKQ